MVEDQVSTQTSSGEAEDTVTDKGPGGEDEKLSRGSTVVHDRVAQRLAVQAALETEHVCPHSSGLDKITGKALPHAQLTVRGNRVRGDVKVAVQWPAPAVQVARNVQRNVVRALSGLAGFDVDDVDVTVAHVSRVSSRRVQ